MTLSRRKFIALTGGGVVLAAAATTAGFLSTRTPEAALVPWKMAGAYDDPRLNAVSFALLAPNPHNLQPWKIELSGSDALIVHHDPSRRLPETDPFDRQIIIGMGCFLEQLKIAASAAGYVAGITAFPDGDAGPVAHVRLVPGGEPDPLFAQIMQRRSCKEPFADREVPRTVLSDLTGFADIYAQEGDVKALRELTWNAWLTEAMTPRTMQESVDLMRFGKAEIIANPDGIDLGGPFLESLMVAGVLTREDQQNPKSRGFQEGVKIYREMLMATPAYVALTTTGNTRGDQIDAGRRWLRLNLRTTGLGLALHPVSQCLQEYPEMAPHYATAHQLLSAPGETVQMLGRLGYGPATPRTPRWGLEHKVIDG